VKAPPLPLQRHYSLNHGSANRADDGMDLIRVETFQSASAAGLPSEADLSAKIDKMAADLKELRKAPQPSPTTARPCSADAPPPFFFHEVLAPSPRRPPPAR